ncbi:epoxyqueuosine reductase QueH [Neglectibacter caecimuris]|uniref:epoxyqueuosine reductase QueH n=1 Tax=Neglectibacter caecimuris TaxID=3093658 RepID=UPI002AC97030|nr:epoxyqueuosine reductase QueH [Neglectibacter sp. M00184]
MSQGKRNYGKELETLLREIGQSGKRPSLLLHACCAPCSSYVLEYLSRYFSISVLYYNPNISPKAEYEKRKTELERLLSAMPLEGSVTLLPCAYEGEAFLEAARGLEQAPEGGERCERCFRLRLRRAAQEAKTQGFDYFTTTLSISPLKNAELLNRIGEEVGAEFGVAHLPADFKKKEGYKRSIELSREYSLYRQNYCGCVFSKAQREVTGKEG